MGLLDKVYGAVVGATDYVADKARHSDDPAVVSQYLNLFDQRVEQGNLELLEKMLQNEEYCVRLDSGNDWKRRDKIDKRLFKLRKERKEQIEKERKSYQQWLFTADIDDLELGLSQGKYQIRFDDQNDQTRKEELEKRLLPLQAEREATILRDGRIRMANLFREYLTETEAQIYKSYYIFCDFKKELNSLENFQWRILHELYGQQIEELLSKSSDELTETLSNYSWQISKQKLIAGKSLMILMLAEKQASGDLQATLTETLSKMDDLVFHNAYSPYMDESDHNLSAEELLSLGNAAKSSGNSPKAVSYYDLAAKKGNPEAMARLGMAFLYSLGIEGDNDKAFYWLVEASKKNSPEGLYGLGVCYRWGYGVNADTQKAIILFKESFSLGCSAGLYGLGCYFQAEGPDKDPVEAFKWHLRAAKKGCLAGMVETYVNYSNGIGVEADRDAARNWFVKLCEASSQENSCLDLTAYTSFRYLGRAFTNGWNGTGGVDTGKARFWFQKGTDTGDRSSKTWLIDFNEYETKNQILNELAEVNYSWALQQLGDYYGSGTGLPKDEVLSRYYYLKAAKYGDVEAQYNIGMAYLDGKLGISQNLGDAMKWLKMAADQGSAEAKSEFEKCVETKRVENERRVKTELQARKNAELAKKSKLDDQLSEFTKQFELCNKKIDNAASEKEETIAIAERDEAQSKVDKLKARISQINENIKMIDMEMVSAEGVAYEEPSNEAISSTTYEDTEDPFDEVLRILGKKADACATMGDAPNETKQYETICLLCDDIITFDRTSLDHGELTCPYCGEHLILNVAHTQGELESFLAKGVPTIYLCGDSFDIPGNTGCVTFVGINHPVVCFPEPSFDSDCTFRGVEFNVADFVRLANAAPTPKEKIIWWTKAAEVGDADAQIELATCYEKGIGVESSSSDAVTWYRAAAEQGNPKAEDILGNCYKNGYGVEQNYALAAEWYRKAADHEVPSAQNSLGILYWNGNGVERNYEEANKWFLRAAEHGYGVAQHNIGTSYRDGQGIEKDKDKAIEWLQKASAQGVSSAKEDLIRLSPELFDLSDVLPYAIGGINNLRGDRDSISITRTDVRIKVCDRHVVSTDMLRVFNVHADVERNIERRYVKVDFIKEGLFKGMRKALFTDEYLNVGDEFYKEEFVDVGYGTVILTDNNIQIEDCIRRAFPDHIK